MGLLRYRNLSILFLRFSVYELVVCGLNNRTFNSLFEIPADELEMQTLSTNFSFNSLFEIPLKRMGVTSVPCFDFTFNSLFEILSCYQLHDFSHTYAFLSILFLRFLIVPSTFAQKAFTSSLSILFLRFMTWTEPSLQTTSLTFNSLFEIQQ